MNSGFSEFVGVGVASMLNKDLGILLKENKGDKIKLEIDTEHPEYYSFPKNLWNLCIQGGDWLPPIKSQ